jgi:glutathione S-transferase
MPVILDLPGADSEKVEQAKQKVSTVLQFFDGLLDERPFFGSDSITLAEPVAGTIIPWLQGGGVSLSDYPKLSAWCDRIQSRPSWQNTAATPEIIEAFKSIMATRMSQRP